MPSVVLVHGIWMNGLDMALLGRRLRAAGFSTTHFSYHSISDSIDANSLRLHELLAGIVDSEVHVVAHSLGGLLVRHLLARCPDDISGSIVTLGTPHQGSQVAAKLRHSKFGSRLLGKSVEILVGSLPAIRYRQQFGVIAGSKPLGIGMLLGSLEKPHDGTVMLSESKLEGMSDYRVMRTNHMGLLFSRQVAEEVIRFLKTGRFSIPSE
jgi:pimeloyl-ACP methyl ester carboxylesterase